MPKHRDSTLQVATSERLDALNPTAWDELTQHADVFMRRPYLEAMEQAPPTNLSPRYALLFSAAGPVAALAMQLVRFNGRVGVSKRSPLSGVAQFVEERTLVLGSLAGWGQTGVALAPGLEAADVWPDIARVLDGVRRFEKSRGTINLTVLKDVGALASEPLMRKAGYERVPAGADMHLALPWPSFEGYLAALNSKSRNAVHRTLREVDAAGYVCRRLSAVEVALAEPRLDQLYGQVWSNADVRPIRLSGRFFVELKARFGEVCEVLALEKNGQLDAFAVGLKNQNTCVAYYLGFERAVEAPLYLRLLVAMIELGLQWRSESISLGRTAEEPKARLGATAAPGWIWAKHRTPPLNWAVGAIMGTVPEPESPSHRVFKHA